MAKINQRELDDAAQTVDTIPNHQLPDQGDAR